MLSNISGFPEFLPQEQIAFNKIVSIIKEQFELCGFSPLDTPAVERISTLLAKGNDNEIYGIHRLAGEGSAKDKDLALRFDLTVPLARYVAQHYSKLTLPYRRYHIAPVWRGERPQAGRYRQFYQCDIDIIGDNNLPLVYDGEILSVAYEIFQAIGLKKFIIKINNRCILTGLIKSFGISEEKVHNVMRTIDKAEKISQDTLTAEFDKQGIEDSIIVKIIDLINHNMSNNEWLEYLSSICTHTEMFTGIDELKKVFNAAQSFGITDSYLQIDPMLARGLGYYTGTVMEIKALDYPELGSVCGGGRYANLALAFSNKKLPGVGISIGISRLIPKLIASRVLQADAETPAVVLVTSQNSELMPEYIKITRILRKHNIYTELYPATKPLAAQMSYANKKGFKFAIIASEIELKQGYVILRSLFDSKQHTTTLNQAIELIKQQSN